MRLRAVGRYLLVKMAVDEIEEQHKKSLIQLSPATIAKEKGGVQLATILSVGESAFDDEPPSVQDMDWVGRQVLTARYPGHEIGINLRASDAKVNEYRMINSSEVHAVVAREDEEGVNV